MNKLPYLEEDEGKYMAHVGKCTDLRSLPRKRGSSETRWRRCTESQGRKQTVIVTAHQTDTDFLVWLLRWIWLPFLSSCDQTLVCWPQASEYSKFQHAFMGQWQAKKAHYQYHNWIQKTESNVNTVSAHVQHLLPKATNFTNNRQPRLLSTACNTNERGLYLL